ncbi:hypothetical protein FQV27_17085 [Paracoccus aurantiacus]|uniref:Uncharacterized protein n=1 Tax=Paracoccus aurantiacus TaxID=2599412 RepID=A0A5C6RTM2_9RHOB|nr:hypothetical protein [Paracoccus aurantiacus]TXB65020.1 hypothetical protein FQV27_17085 [Paracoccus aurantiacus]
MTMFERLVVAIADCPEGDLRFILSAVLEDICAGEPAPDSSGVDQEAENWAALASDDELRAYFVACGVTASPEAGLARAASSGWPRERWRARATKISPRLRPVSAAASGMAGNGLVVLVDPRL